MIATQLGVACCRYSKKCMYNERCALVVTNCAQGIGSLYVARVPVGLAGVHSLAGLLDLFENSVIIK